ncbi:MAG: hypothetical protein KME43_16805 [Myxacorys chilensis ATA2-1-KO14]|jgi:hypothetical protein|nr:hypothetical protein [Myxacorys chilensis ATA2-1-KO14]
MKKNDVLPKLTQEVLNDPRFKESFSYIEKYCSTKKVEEIQELIKKELEKSWGEIWANSIELIQNADKEIQKLEIEQENFVTTQAKSAEF